ncbi:hypothetical protein CRUP_020990 [Coryphaenoides rupestris]|nr:hypothetical protein CRUP_020990 [Coryphaenoides rupestris]
MRDLHTFVNDTPTQIDFLISQYSTTERRVVHDLDNVGPLLGGRIHQQLGKEEASGKLAFSLSLMRSSLERSLDDPACRQPLGRPGSAQPCLAVQRSLSRLHLHANYSRLASVNPQLEKMNQVLQTDLRAIIQKGYASLNSTPSLVVEQTTSVVEGVRGLLDGIASNISSFSRSFPVQSSLTKFTIDINHAHSAIEDRYPQLDQMDFYRWMCCIALCCMVVLVLAFNYLALLCGTLGYDKHASPTTRGCISNTGGTLLMAKLGEASLRALPNQGDLSGNLEKLLCEPFQTKEIFQVLDTPYIVKPEWKNFVPGYMYNDSDLDLTVLDTPYIVKPEWKNFVPGYMYNDSDLDLTVVLLEPAGKQNLLDFSESGLSEINYAQYLEEVNKGVTVVDLLTFTSELETQTDLMSALNQSMRFLERTASDLPNKVLAVLNAIDAAQYLISQNASHLVNQHTEEYKQTIVGYFQQYIDWVKTSLAMDVATCKPFSNVVDTAHIFTCNFVMDSMNTFWMGLGCSTLLLLPSIILAAKLSKSPTDHSHRK